MTLQAPAKIGYAFGSTAADAAVWARWGGEAPLDVHGGTSGSWPFGQRQHKHIGASGDTSSGAVAGHAGAPGRSKAGTHPPGDRLACENELPLMCGECDYCCNFSYETGDFQLAA